MPPTPAAAAPSVEDFAALEDFDVPAFTAEETDALRGLKTAARAFRRMDGDQAEPLGFVTRARALVVARFTERVLSDD